ncbi:MAG: hypothetical protein ACXWK7_17520 [Caulobacteraceae bacterium]
MTTDPYDPIRSNPGQPDPLQIVMPRREPRARAGGRAVLLAGVAGACVLGVGAGLWARPAMNERRVSVPEADAPAPAPPMVRKLQIVVDERPAPVGAPIEVLPRTEAVPPGPEPREPEDQAPRRPAEGLMRVIGPALALTAQKLTHPHFPAPPTLRAEPPAPLAEPAKVVARAAPPPRAPTPDVQAIRIARAQAQAGRQAALDAERQAKAAAQKVELAKAEARGHARALAEAREQARAERLAQAEQARKQQVRLAALVRSLAHALPRKAKPEPPPILVARQDRKPPRHQPAHPANPGKKAEPKVVQVALKTRKAHPTPPRLTQASHPVRPRPEPAAPLPRASGLMRVSTHCASRDPGEALVCADPNLGAAERQLSRAYQGARAAGVPDAELRQQQQRWLAARSAAAREAPWAVRDVYLARIAELNGQAREAHGDGY